MLSPSSCRIVDRKQSKSRLQDVFGSGNQGGSDEIQGGSTKAISSKSAMGWHRLVRLSTLFVCLLLVGNQFKCLVARSTGGGSSKSPCICNDTFYPECPSFCSSADKSLMSENHGANSFEHDTSHPDHIEDPVDRLSILNGQSEPVADDEQVVWHRKIYLADKKEKPKPIIHPVTMTIPIDIEEDPTTIIPPPKPIFKMRKYTTYESQTIKEMVPVTTTVIKPVGISEDHIIEDKA